MSMREKAENNRPLYVEFQTDAIDQMYQISICLASIADSLAQIEKDLKRISRSKVLKSDRR